VFKLIFLVVVGVMVAIGAAIWYSPEGKTARKTLAPVVDQAAERAGDVGEKVAPVLKKKVHEMTAETPDARPAENKPATEKPATEKKPKGPAAGKF